MIVYKVISLPSNKPQLRIEGVDYLIGDRVKNISHNLADFLLVRSLIEVDDEASKACTLNETKTQLKLI